MVIRVLIVDDHSVVRQGLQMFLGLEPEIEVVGEARNGVEALHMARKHKPDVVLMDLLMPEMNGQELVDRLLPLQPNMRVLFISGYSEDIFSGRNVLDPGTLYVQKPFTPVELLGKVRHVLDSE